MSNWNFRGYVALPLEEYGKKYLGKSWRTADEIECGEFVDTMLTILFVKFDYSLDDVSDFAVLSEEYKDLPASKIPKEIAIELFEEFQRLVNVQ